MRVDAITQKAKQEKVPKSSKKFTGTIHHVHILDSSGSMAGGKYENAISGINLDIRSIKDTRKDFQELTETMTIVEFGGWRTTKHITLKKVEDVDVFVSRNIGGGTPLYQTIGETIDYLLKEKKKEDKVVLKIFTDGGENSSIGEYRNYSILKNLISKVEKEDNFTITFVGTEGDVRTVNKLLGIDMSNMLVHDNTVIGTQTAFLNTVSSTHNYRKSVLKGKNVTTNFYTKTIENEQS